MTNTDENKAFIKEMLGLKKQLTDYPDRFDPAIAMHEPLMLPFGGDYVGTDDFQKFYPQVRRYYDFSTWELLGVYGDGDTVFATTRVQIADSSKSMYIAEQFTLVGSLSTCVCTCAMPLKLSFVLKGVDQDDPNDTT